MSRSENFPKRRGSAFFIVIGITFLFSIIAYGLYNTTISGRWLTVRSSNDQKAMDCAEAASNLVYRLVAEDMNDQKMIYDALSFKKLDIDNWFLKFRLPQVMAGANVDPLQFKNDSISEAQTSGNGLGLEINVGPEMALKLQKTYEGKDLVELEDMVREMGGDVKIKSEARIAKVFGILPKSNTYEVPGVTLDLSEANNFTDLNVGKFLNSIMSDEDFKIDITNQVLNFLPDVNFGTIVQKAIDKLNFNLAIEAVAVPIPIGKLLGALFKGLTNKLLGDNATLKGFLKNTLLKDLKLEIDLSKLKKSIKEKILGIFPDEIKSLAGAVSWGVTVEKIGIFEVKTTVEYQPQGSTGVTIKKTLLSQRDFRVADIQPIAPDHSFFVANSKLLFEDPGVENTSNFQGDEAIQWEKGQGSLVIHNITFFDESLFKKLKDFFAAVGDFNLEKICNSFFLPGQVRVNGTKRMIIRLNFGLLDFLSGGSFIDALKGCEIAALLVNDKDKNKHVVLDGDSFESGSPKHNFIPAMGESIYGTGFESIPPIGGWVALFNVLEGYLEGIGSGNLSASDFLSVPIDALKLQKFDWPWVTDSLIWIPIPKFYNKTYLFGDFHAEFPLSFRVEGNLWKKFSRLSMPMIRIFIFLNWFFGCPNVDITLPPIPFNSTVVEPYGFCSYPPCENS
ncbi:hypothetical protein HYY75_08595, partial [bacterium]|nr:hypothetical protein [bacterium]